MERVIEGFVFGMGALLGDLFIAKHNRNYSSTSKSAIDWNASFKLKEELEEEGVETYDKKERPNGKKWFVRFDAPFYLRFYWTKKECKVKNMTAYKFKPTRGAVGNTTKLKQRLEGDDLAHLDYKLVEPRYGSV